MIALRRPPTAEAVLLARAPSARRLLLLADGAGVLAAVAVVAAAWLLSAVIASVFLEDGTPATVGPLVVGIVLLAIGRAACLFAVEVLAQRAASRLKGTLRDDLTGHLFALGPARIREERSGELASLIVNGLDAIETWLTAYRPPRDLAVVVPILVLLIILVADPPTAIVLMLTGPVLVLLLAFIGSRTRAINARRFAELRWMSGYFLDMLRGIATLKAFGRSAEQVETMRAISARFGETTLEVLRSAFQTGLVLDWAGAVAMALVAVEVSLRLMTGDLAFGRALAVLVITPEFFLPLRTLAQRYHAGTAGGVAAERIVAFLGETPVAANAAVTGAVATSAGRSDRRPIPRPPDLVFERVTYRYADRETSALDDVSLTIPAGRRLTIVGPSGAGKTTAVNLLLRFLEPDRGLIRVGDRALSDIDPVAWRSTIAWVPQAPYLFAGSVAENLRLARPGASDAELRDAARRSDLAIFIEQLPSGYDTQVGEGGLRLSGGQRQRLAIARALLRDAGLVILDEPTAHLDGEGEAVIADVIDRLAGSRTVVVVSHRPRLARTSDLVAVMDGGRLLESGTPADLLRAGGAFARLEAAWPAEIQMAGEGDARIAQVGTAPPAEATT